MTNEVFTKTAEALTSALGRTPTKNEVIGTICATMAHMGIPAKTIITEVCGASAWDAMVDSLYATLRA